MTPLPLPPAGPPPCAPGRRLIPFALAVALALPLLALLATAAFAAPEIAPETASASDAPVFPLDVLGAVLAVDVAALAVLRAVLTGLEPSRVRPAGLPETGRSPALREIAGPE